MSTNKNTEQHTKKHTALNELNIKTQNEGNPKNQHFKQDDAESKALSEHEAEIEAANKKRVDQFANARLTPLILKFAFPTMIGMTCGAMQNIINRVFVGHAINATAIAAVQIGLPIISIFMAFASLIGMGSTTLISIRIGQRRKDEAERLLGQAFSLCFVIPSIVCFIFNLFLDDILVFIGASKAVLPYAHDYFRVITIAMIPFSLSTGINNIMRAQGAPFTAMLTQVLAFVVTIITNYFFVVQFGWGVRGAAWGIFIGNTMSFIWIGSFFQRKSSYLRVRLKYIRLFRGMIKPVFILGLTPFLIQLANSLQNLVLNISIINYGGDEAMSALGIVMSFSTILIMPIIGISQGGQPIMGFNYGARNYKRLKGTLVRSMVLGSVFSVLSWIYVMLFPESIVSIFISNEPEIEALAAHALRLFFGALFFVGMQITGASLFQACGKAVRAAFLSLSRQLLLTVPFVLILPLFFGLDGCWLGPCASDALTTIITCCFVTFGLRSIRKELESNEMGSLVR